MKILAISGSTRAASTNTALLKHLARCAPSSVEINIFKDLQNLPIFSPDLEGEHTPEIIQQFANMLHQADGVIISSPEYVRSIPGGLKNAIDWLVSRDEIINKSIALLHASHRGDDMLDDLRTVLSTVSTRFYKDIFVRFPLISKTPNDVETFLRNNENSKLLNEFLDEFISAIK